MKRAATFELVGAVATLAVVFSGCGTTYQPTPPPRNLRGEPLRGTLDPPPGSGDPGVVSGRVEVVQSFAPAAPVAFEEIALYREEALVARSTTDAHGGFMFVGITNGGVYEARVVSARFVGSLQFSLQRGGHLSGAELVVRPVTPPK